MIIYGPTVWVNNTLSTTTSSTFCITIPTTTGLGFTPAISNLSIYAVNPTNGF